MARYALGRLDVDEMGFDRLDQAVLRTLIEKFEGGPVGLDTLAAAVGEDKGTLEDLVESQPGAPVWRVALAGALSRSGDLDEAQVHFDFLARDGCARRCGAGLDMWRIRWSPRT